MLIQKQVYRWIRKPRITLIMRSKIDNISVISFVIACIISVTVPLVGAQMDFPFYHPQWENTGQVWDGDCDRVEYNCPPEKYFDCWHPPFCPYHPIEVDLRDQGGSIGRIVGRSMVTYPHRYVNLFLGVPYAKPPVYERRFKVFRGISLFQGTSILNLRPGAEISNF